MSRLAWTRVANGHAIEEAWTNELSSRVDDIVGGKVTAISGAQVFADIAARRAAPHA